MLAHALQAHTQQSETSQRHTQEPEAWEFEIDPQDLVYNEEQVLGRGSFGGECVWVLAFVHVQM